VLEQVKLETKDEKYHMDRLEQGLVVAYDKIPKSAQTTELTTMQKIDQIVQTIDQYRQEIEHLREQLIPTTPPEVKEKRKQEATTQIEEMERQVRAAVDLFDKATQLWTKLEEDQQVQQWDQEEEKISAAIQDLKQRQKTMSITEHLKGAQDMKKLQAELIATQTQKKERQAQMEPLQERAAEVIAQAEEAKKNMAQTQAECTEMISDEIAVQVLDALREKTTQAQTQAKELTEKFQALAGAIEEAHKV
jgi:DNA repair exonuclease SbcCD ATPase subunit